MKTIPTSKTQYAAPRVLVDQNDLFNTVFTPLIDTEHIGAILLVYLSSLARLKIVAQDDLSRMIVRNLVQHQQLEVLRKLLDCALLHESKVLACFLLSLSGTHQAIQQMALDMLDRLKDNNVSVHCYYFCICFYIININFVDHRWSFTRTGQSNRRASISHYIALCRCTASSEVPRGSPQDWRFDRFLFGVQSLCGAQCADSWQSGFHEKFTILKTCIIFF